MDLAELICEVQLLDRCRREGENVQDAQDSQLSRGGAGRKQAANSEILYNLKRKGIHVGQLKAVTDQLEVGSVTGPRSVSAQDFYGNWTDSFGNLVFVYSRDAFKSELVAHLSRPPRSDIMLHITPMAGGSGWSCGNAVLSCIGEFAEEISWQFPNGCISVWRRPTDVQSPSAPMYPMPPIPPEPHNEGGEQDSLVMTCVLVPYYVPSEIA